MHIVYNVHMSNSKYVQISIDNELHETAKAKAEADHRSLSNYITSLIHKDINDPDRYDKIGRAFDRIENRLIALECKV